MINLNTEKAKEFIINALACNEIPYLAGQPGIGKSAIVKQVAAHYKLILLDVRLSQMLPEDLVGLPRFNENNNKASYVPFDTFPFEDDEIPEGYNGWLIFLDELSSASEEIMSAIYSLLLDRKLGNKNIHKNACIVAAGNRSFDSAIARELPDTLITRMLPIEVTVAHKHWINWLKNNPNKNESVIAFIEKYNDLLIGTKDIKNKDELESYPTPRGWEKVCKILNTLQKNEENLKEVTVSLISSAVGTMAAKTFEEHYFVESIPDPCIIASDPYGTPVPSRESHVSRLIDNLSAYIVKTSPLDIPAILSYVNRLHKEQKELFLDSVRYSQKFKIDDLESMYLTLGVSFYESNRFTGTSEPIWVE